MNYEDKRSEWEKVDRRILNAKCTDVHFSKIAEKMIEWEKFVPGLGLTESKKVEIQKSNNNNYPQQKYQFLIEWRRQYGSRATYRELFRCFDEYKEGELVEELMAIVEKG